MPIQYKAGTPANRNFDPKGRNGAADARGVYQTSAFYAPLCFNDEGTFTLDPDVYTDNTFVQLLLFTSDLPLICRTEVLDTNTEQTATHPCGNLLTLNNAFVTDAAGGGVAVTLANYGEVLVGFSGVGQLVPVSGFPCTSVVTPPLGTTVTEGEVQPGLANSVSVLCLSNSGDILGVIGKVYDGKSTVGGSILAPTPIILKSSDYTAAMRATKNVITEAVSLKQYQIVGLWYGNARA
jgi:hypothetical protein